MEKIVIADTPIWRNFLEGKSVRETQELEKLIDKDKIAICGYTLIKILQSIKDKETFEKLLKGFLALPYVEIEKEDRIKASKIVFEFEGLSIELGLLCALSQRKNLKILTKNKEIKKVKGAKIYEDEKE